MTFPPKRSKHVDARRISIATRAFFTLFLIISLSPLACTPGTPTTGPVNNTATTGVGLSPLTFFTDADAQVNEEDPDKNAGMSAFLQVDGFSEPGVECFIRFTVTGVSAPIQNAQLRVYDTTNASDNGPAVYATDASWTESEITWNNRPIPTDEELDNQGMISAGTWVGYDVTAAVTGNGTFSFVLIADSSDATTFSSRQGSQPPQLVITLAGGSTPTMDSTTATVASPSETATSGASAPSDPIFITAEADARVSQSEPTTNFGDGSTLRSDGAGDSEYESFLRFTVPGEAGPVQSARLRVYVTNNGTDNGPAVYTTDNAWEENSITWDNRPGRTSDALDNKDSLGTNSWVEYDVTLSVTGSGTFSFVLVADSSDGVVFSSREGDQPPQLVLNSTGGNTSTAVPTVHTIPTVAATLLADEPVLVGAGDISECNSNNDELTAQLLDTIPGTVFTTGDNAYGEGTLEEYNNCYGPTWGRHKERTKPTPGNHEYISGAEGYFQYFDNIPEYYAYNLGSWRIYALNSEIDVSLSSPQMVWLVEDLAANPSQCVLAYWHQPRWSSGSHHGSDEDYHALWQILYEAGAELVINGHEHNYERFAEMNTQGAVSSSGLREIVVGTGGRDLYEFDSPLPASEVRDNSAYGVLKVTLHANSYAWEFIPIPGSTFTDSGSTNCH